jgi:CO/xanthine dehydrogenase FAD-binding subunit
MRSAVSTLDLATPRDLGEALALLAASPRTPLAGCTDLYVALNGGTLAATRFLDLSALDELHGIALDNGRLVIGALATHAEIERSPLVAAAFPLLARAAAEIGGPQIRHRGTLGGNLVNGSPAGDLLPALAVGEATIVLASARGERRVAYRDFFTGYRATVLAADELVRAVEISPPEGAWWYRKVGTRAAQAITKVALAALREPDGGCRLAFGSVGPTVTRHPRSEAALAISVAAAQRALGEEIRPIDDLRSTAEYRLAVARNLLARFAAESGEALRARDYSSR